LSGRGLCDGLITRPEESYRLCCVVVCDLETSRMGAPYIYDISHLRVNYLLQGAYSGSLLVKKVPAFYGTRRFITAFTSALHISLSWARSIQPIPTQPTSWRSILILPSHLCLGFPSGLFSQVFPPKPCIGLHTVFYLFVGGKRRGAASKQV